MGVEDDLSSVEVFSPTSGQWRKLPAEMKAGWKPLIGPDISKYSALIG